MKESEGPPHLKRALNRWDMALLTVGSVIGSGIFLVPGEVAIATMMSPLLASLVWIAGAALSLCGAFTFAELARIRPDAGGLYIYIRDGHGLVAAYVFGWMCLFVNVAGTVAALAAAAANLLRPYLPPAISPAMIAVSLTLLLGGLNLLPTRRSGEIQGWTAAAKLIAVFVFAALLIVRALSSASIDSFQARGTSILHPDYIVALVAVLWAFEGWQYATCASGEAQDAERSVAFGLIVGVAALALVYLLTSLAVTLWLTPTDLATSTNVIDSALRKAGFFGFAALVTIILPLAILSAAHATLLTGSRVVYAMATDGLMPSSLARVSERTGIPSLAVIACTLIAAVLAWLGTFDTLLAYVIVTSWLFYGLAGFAVFRIPAVARHRHLSVNIAAGLFCAGAAGVMLFGLIGGPPSARYGLAIAALGWITAIIWFRHKKREQRKE